MEKSPSEFRGDPAMTPGTCMRALRESRGKSLRDVAFFLGWDKGLVSKKERDILGVDLGQLEEFAEILDADPRAFALFVMMNRYSLNLKELMDIWETL